MKIQDIIAGAIMVFLLTRRDGKLWIFVGLSCFVIAMPLFARWIFFTAERMVWYGVCSIFIGILIRYVEMKHPDAKKDV